MLPLGLPPFLSSYFQYSPCLFKSFARLMGSNMKTENISFPVLNRGASGVIQVGNFRPHLPDLPILFFRGLQAKAHLLFRFVNTSFGGRHVRLTNLDEAIDAMQFLLLFGHWIRERRLVRVESRVEDSSARCLRKLLMLSIFSMARSMRGLEPRLYAPMLIRSSESL